ncbi:MAG: DJ-1/PfpI family protein [Myxococcota bacterium]
MSRRTTTFCVLWGLVGCASHPHTDTVFPAASVAQDRGAVVFVLTAANEQTLADGTTRDTGFFLNEFYEAYRHVVDHGYSVVIATPGGVAPVVDPESLDEDYWGDHPERIQEAERLMETRSLLEPLSLEEALATVDQFQGIVVPGGQGVMEDLLESETLHSLLHAMAQRHRAIGLICHAPALLLRMRENNPLEGRMVTSVTGLEEWFIETFVMNAEARFRRIGKQLARAGYDHVSAFPGRGHARRDCNLVTSQNPFSGEEFSTHFLAALEDARRGARCVPNP